MAGSKQSFKVLVIVLLLGAALLIVEASNGKHGKKRKATRKAANQLLFSDDEDVMLGDEPVSSGDGPAFPDNEASSSPTLKPSPPANELDPGFSIDGLPDINELLPEGGTHPNWPSFKPPVRPPIGSPCHPGTPCPPVQPPCHPGTPCPPVQPPCHPGTPCPPVQPPCHPGTPCPPVQRPCHPGKPCPPAPPPCHSGHPCRPAKPPCRPNRPCHSTNPCHSSKGPCNSLRLPPAYSTTKVCGKTYFCRKGFSGPCFRNEVFTSSPSHLSRPVSLAHSTCARHFSPPPGCFSSSHRSLFALEANSSPGYCTIRYAHQPCYGYSSPTPGPCPAGQYFTAQDHSYGYCRCSRPSYVHCPKTNRCYPAYTKGSCPSGHWLVPHGNHGLSTCKTCPCPSLADGRHMYWSGKGQQQGRPGCYRTHTVGPCRPGMQFVISNMLTGSAHCVRNHSGWRRPSSSYHSLLNDWNLFYGRN